MKASELRSLIEDIPDDEDIVIYDSSYIGFIEIADVGIQGGKRVIYTGAEIEE
ncbi:MAG TPA: hypothetical protein VF944_10835 [Candidatus Bathyarchaeia archaeon]